MEYNADDDYYVCGNGRKLIAEGVKNRKHRTGYVQTTTIYRCENCDSCEHRKRCIRGNNCKTLIEERTKVMYVSKLMKQKREEDLERITSEYGTRLRMNRSIQVEGSFADIKADMEFRRYKYRGMENVRTPKRPRKGDFQSSLCGFGTVKCDTPFFILKLRK